MNEPIHVLLATYEGARFLPAFLASLRRQWFTNWRLIVRDDGSHDETRTIITDAAAHDARITLLPADGRRLGAKHNFGELAAWAVANGVRYAAFADQDDLWRADKLEKQFDSLRRLEMTHGREHPLLVHSDMGVIDARDRVTAESYARLAGVRHPPAGELTAHLWANDVAGCTILTNATLLRRAVPVPTTCVMHDWWLALCAAACGRIEYDSRPLVQYRLHGANTVGGGSPWQRVRNLPRTLTSQWQKLRDDFAAAVEQMHTLIERLESDDRPPNRAITELRSYVKLLRNEPSVWKKLHGVLAASRTRMHSLREAALAIKVASYCPPLRETPATEFESRRAA